MERLGLLDFALPMLSDYLKQHYHGLEAAPTIRIIGVLGEAIGAGFEPPRGFLLACLLTHVSRARQSGSAHLVQHCAALRARGFSRGDTEQLRLLLEAIGHMLKPSRITRRLARRPYFPLARRLFELTAPIFAADPADLDLFPDRPAGASARNPKSASVPSNGRYYSASPAPKAAWPAQRSRAKSPLARHRRFEFREKGRGQHRWAEV